MKRVLPVVDTLHLYSWAVTFTSFTVKSNLLLLVRCPFSTVMAPLQTKSLKSNWLPYEAESLPYLFSLFRRWEYHSVHILVHPQNSCPCPVFVLAPRVHVCARCPCPGPVHIHAHCPCPCPVSMSMPGVRVRVHARCPFPCPVAVSILLVHARYPCLMCMSSVRCPCHCLWLYRVHVHVKNRLFTRNVTKYRYLRNIS